MSEPVINPEWVKSLEDENNKLRDACVEKDWEILGLNRTIDEQKQLVDLLARVPHHGPTGSWSLPQKGQCWADCVACEFEKLSAPSGAVASAASGTANNPAAK